MRFRHAVGPNRVTPRLVVALAAAAALAGGTIAMTEVAQAKDQVARAAAGQSEHLASDEHAGDRTARDAGTVHVIGPAAQRLARSYWTAGRMDTATGSGLAGSGPARSGGTGGGPSAAQAVPPGTPDATQFSGVPTVGALFYTQAGRNHFCTASVVNSTVGSLVLTAAHCVYANGRYARNMEFIPGYNGGPVPDGIWPVTQITVAGSWRSAQNPDLDIAFLDVAPPPDAVGPIQSVTGALRMAFALPDAQHITVIGYNDTAQRPVICVTKSFRFRADQMEFYCRGFSYGTSGGPWILDYRGGQGTGTVYGVIGGYEQGGDVSWASFSAALERPAQELLAQAEAGAAKAG